MTQEKITEIKALMFSLMGTMEESDLVTKIERGYIFGEYGNNEHYSYYDLRDMYREVVLEHTQVPVYSQFINWFDKTCQARVNLSDEAVANIAIEAADLITYCHQNNLTMEKTANGASVYLDYVLPEHQAIFEPFGGQIETNPYPTSIQFEAMTVAQLNAFKEEYQVEIEGWNEMLKADKCAALINVVYPV